LFALSLPANADWLVTTEGEAIETIGPWKVDGRRIVYTSVNGALSAVRATAIDLDASEAATRKAREPKPAPVQKKDVRPQKAALVLDQSSVGTHRAAPVAPLSADADPGEDTADTSGGSVSVVSWEETQEPGSDLRIEGVVQNDTVNFATNIDLVVTVYDPDGKPAGTKPAQLAKQALGVGQQTAFAVDFPGLYLTSGVTFKVTNRSFMSRKADEPDDEGSEGSGSEPPEQETPNGER
jgi:hypothetical protein